MGKPYSSELTKLPDTIAWAISEPIEEITSFIDACFKYPLYVVGSGGSLTAAQLVRLLHENFGGFSKSITPYELLTTGSYLRNSNILLLTARGTNPDIISAFKYAAKSEPRNLSAICLRPNSILKQTSEMYNYAKVIDFDIPSGKDGFLATNSLIAFCVILIRAYEEIFQQNFSLSTELGSWVELYKSKIESNSILNSKTFIVLYGKWGLPAAVDFESKFIEAAIGNVQLADFRNFAHGRHYWFAKNGRESGIVAIYTPEEERMVNKTLEQIPKEIPIYRIKTAYKGPKGALQLLIKTMYFIKLVADHQNIDPGCPSVPTFGRKIYRLNVNSLIPKDFQSYGISKECYIPIKRKINVSLLNSVNTISIWTEAYKDFIKKLRETEFGSIIFDYDGTLCDADLRFAGISKAIGAKLKRLLEEDIIIGVVSGRGKSVKDDLQKIIPKNYWNNVIVGYYNGGDIGNLAQNNHPIQGEAFDKDILTLESLLSHDFLIGNYGSFEVRSKQISLIPYKKIFWNNIKLRLCNIIMENNLANLKILESGHSIDIIPSYISKKNIFPMIERMAKKLKRPPISLCIGDKGGWSGNDYELLQAPFSLSVDQVSESLETCWNIVPEGYRGTQATLIYLNRINPSKNYFKLEPDQGLLKNTDEINER